MSDAISPSTPARSKVSAPGARRRYRSGWRRALDAIITIFGASILVWSLMPLAPGNPARLILRARGVTEPSPGQLAEVEQRLGLDASLPMQYFSWLGRLLRGDLGTSYVSGRPVTLEMSERLEASARLGLVAFALAVVLALILGMLAAYHAGRFVDFACQGFALVSSSVPSFVVALVLIQIVVIGWGIGQVSLDGQWSQVWLPAICLALAISDTWSRLLRSSLLGFMGSPVAETLAARGAGRMRLLWRHALPGSAVVTLNTAALGLAGLFGGAAIVESVFTWPGIGAYVVEAVKARDIPVIQAFTLIATLIYVAASLIADLVSARIDPRIGAGE